jgi:hypothetical protein
MRVDRPGYKYRKHKTGIAHYWNPQRAIKGAPAYLGAIRLDDDLTDDQIAAKCQALTKQLRLELASHGKAPDYDGTISSLIAQYRFDKTSSLHSVKHSTRRDDYEPSLVILDMEVGKRRIDALKASDFKRWYEAWQQTGHRRAWGAIKMMRGLLTYGSGERLHGCSQAREILSGMRFTPPPARKVAMTFEQCQAIVNTAIVRGAYSIAFVEALKFETALRRIDVIGEFVPTPEGLVWQGLEAGQIDADLILTLTTSKTGAAVKRDLKLLPLVNIAMTKYVVPQNGPIVINENTGKPYVPKIYRRKFNLIRDAAGVPASVWSMDARAGAITETANALSLAAAQELATHSNEKMTAKYNRDDGLTSGAKTAAARNALRSDTALTRK